MHGGATSIFDGILFACNLLEVKYGKILENSRETRPRRLLERIQYILLKLVFLNLSWIPNQNMAKYLRLNPNLSFMYKFIFLAEPGVS